MELGSPACELISKYMLKKLDGDRVNAEDARDLVQEVFARLLRSSARVENLPAFVAVAVRNLRFEQLRKRRVRFRARATLEAFYGESCDSRDAFRFWSAAESVEELSSSLDKMPARRREVWQRVRVSGESQKTVAEHYGVTVKAIEKSLRLADRQISSASGYDEWGRQGSDTHLSLDGSCRVASESIESPG